MTPSVVCDWCKETIFQGEAVGPASHGICADCAMGTGFVDVEAISHLTQEEMDRLGCIRERLGWIALEGDGTIVACSEDGSQVSGRDPKAVIGKNFFRDVAPCTAVKDFQGRHREMRDGGVNTVDDLTFGFMVQPGRSIAAKITMTYDAGSDTTMLVIARLD